MNAPKLCKDCKHFAGQVWPNHDCLYKAHTEVLDLIGGSAAIYGRYCYIERRQGVISTRLFNHCGKEGRWWEAK